MLNDDGSDAGGGGGGGGGGVGATIGDGSDTLLGKTQISRASFRLSKILHGFTLNLLIKYRFVFLNFGRFLFSSFFTFIISDVEREKTFRSKIIAKNR